MFKKAIKVFKLAIALVYKITQPSILINAVPFVASVPNVQAPCEVETKTITVSANPTSVVACKFTDNMVETEVVTATPSSCVQYTQAHYKTEPQIITIPYTFTTTVVVSQTQNNVSLGQSLKAEGSTTAWMMVAILFLLIAISAIVLNVIMGYLLHKKAKCLKISNGVASEIATKESAKEGTVSHTS